MFTSQTQSKRQILVVDDQAVNRTILTKLLEQDYIVRAAADGQEALDICRADGAQLSAIVLDLVMPIMDGYQVLKVLAADSDLCEIPVLVAAGSDGTNEAELKALALGANDYVSKPYIPNILKQRLKNCIALRERTDEVRKGRIDGLTGLPSAAAFYRIVNETIDATPDKPWAVVVMDVARFKWINDRLGMDTGDAVLKALGKAITAYARVAGGFYARLHSDHFAMLLPEAKSWDNESLEQWGHRIANHQDLPRHLTLRFGVYIVERESRVEPPVMCDRARLAIDSIRNSYDTSVAVYDASIRQRLLADEHLEAEMAEALAQGQFEVYYQPKYALDGDRLAGAEALVRWIHPIEGFRNPGEFIPLFERNGFIRTLDSYIWEQVCRHQARCRDLGLPVVPVSVNVSRLDVYDDDLPEKLHAQAQAWGVQPSDLHIEITESAYTENPEQLIEAVNRMRAFGYAIEMDDFGSGYSSLNMLAEMPLDILKLDMRFMQQWDDQGRHQNILGFVISLAKWMDLAVVAEGVETDGQIAYLRNMDCQFVQGYYFAKPMPVDRFDALLGGVTNQPAVQEISKHPAPVPNPGEPLLLIVDDASVTREELAGFFKNDFEIIEAVDGVEALAMVEQYHENLTAIILDLIMPKKDGFQVLEAIKNNIATRDIPVIVTSQPGDTSETKTLSMGAADYISKPYSAVAVRRRVANAIAAHRVKHLEAEQVLWHKRLEAEADARRDILTGLSTYSSMCEQAQAHLARPGVPAATYILVDIDHFARINDVLGHPKGDEMLARVAAILRSCFRSNDLLARQSGNTFAVFVNNAFIETDLHYKLARLRDALAIKWDEGNISVSIGASQAPGDGQDLQTMVDEARHALRQAKARGGDCYQIFNGWGNH